MRLKVELHPDVQWFIKHRCNAAERRVFYQQLDAVRSEPIKNSEPTFEPQVSHYILRFFRFGTNLAIFRFEPAVNLIWVLKCRTLKPPQKENNLGENGPGRIA